MHKEAKGFIVFPLDFPSMEEALAYVRLLDGHVGMFKIGLELFIRQGPAVVEEVRALTRAKIFLDLKLHDISATVGRAMARAADLGVDLITVHEVSPNLLWIRIVGAERNVKGALTKGDQRFGLRVIIRRPVEHLQLTHDGLA